MLPPALRLLLALLLVCVVADTARADDTVPRDSGVAVDGVADEEAWTNARVLPVQIVDAPALPPDDGTAKLEPRLRVVESDGYLCFALEVDEDPSSSIGLILKIATDGTKSAADAVEIAYRPQSLRAAAFVVRGPKGIGRSHYPVDGKAVSNAAGRWSLELRVLTRSLDPTGTATFRVGAAVLTRTQNLVASSPEGAVFHGPDAWHVLASSGDKWFVAEAPDVDPLEREDQLERERLAVWNQYLAANYLLDRQPLAGRADDVIATIDAALIRPLERILALRPDLAPGIRTIQGDIYRQLGRIDEADVAFEAALAASPGFREAKMTRALTVGVHRFVERAPDQPSDYAAAYAALDAVDASTDPWLADAATASRGILLFREGRFSEADKLLTPMAERYPFARLIVMTWQETRRELRRFADEHQESRRDAKRDLPRARVTTSKGDIVLELFQEHAPNAVNNFVWLAREGFFDGMAWHRAVPFLGVQTGDPFSKPEDAGGDPALVGLGGPGYDIPAQPSGRLPYRGAVAFVLSGTGAVGSQFMLLTGTAAHADGDLFVFGRVIEGMDVADALVQNDRIESVEVLRVRDGWSYEPTDLAGRRPDRAVPTAPPPPDSGR